MESKEMFLKTKVTTIRKGFSMFENMLKLMARLEEVGTISKVQLEKEMGFPVQAMLEWLEQFHKVKAEVRKEEFISIKVSGIVRLDKDGKIIPEFIKAYDLNGNEYDVPNPNWRGKARYVENMEKQIQVSRKYYTWVG